jgi:D-galactonate transporter
MSAEIAADQSADHQTNLNAVYRKVTLRLIPFLFLAWILAWIDRVNIGFAKLTMLQDLAFSQAVYGLGAGIFFIGYFFFEVPSNLLLTKIGARKTIARIMIGWGVVCALQMFVETPWQFYTLRFLLGAFEAGFYPGVILYLTYWFPTERRARAFGQFMAASAIAGVLGGPIAGTIMTGLGGVGGLAGWQWLFLIEGIPSVIVGVTAFFYLTDRPHEATWLNAVEKDLLEKDMERDHAGAGPREHSFLASLRDPRIWLLILVFFCIIAGNSTLTFWGPTIISDLGVDDPFWVGMIAALPYIAGAIGMVMNGRHSDKMNEHRYHTGLAALLGAVSLAAVALLGNHPVLAMIALTLATVGTMSAIPVFWQLPARYMTGTAIAGGIALINSIANLAGFGAPWALGVIRDATGQLSLGLYGIAAIEGATLFLILIFIKKRAED